MVHRSPLETTTAVAVAVGTATIRMAKARLEVAAAMGRRPPTEPQIHPLQEMKLLPRFAELDFRTDFFFFFLEYKTADKETTDLPIGCTRCALPIEPVIKILTFGQQKV